MNSFLVPANSKKGELIFNIFRPFDLIIFVVGLAISLVLLMFVELNNTWIVAIACFPAALSGFLVLPIPNYHNVLCVIQSIYRFYFGQRNYKWRGWCFYEKFGNEK